MNCEYIQVARVVTVPNGGSVTVPFPANHPYKDLTVWMMGAALSLTAQMTLGGINQGAGVAFNSASPLALKVFQMTADEIRPASQGLKPYMDSDPLSGSAGAVPMQMETAVVISSVAAGKQNVTVYMVATAFV